MGNERSNGGDTIRFYLRNETSADHARLDRMVTALDLSDRRDYTTFLRGSAAALLPLEFLLEDAGVDRLLPDWPRRSRRSAILADLSQLSDQPPPSPIRLERILGSDAAMLGALYVLEGSRLGARQLRTRVTSTNDPVVAGATRYLAHGAGDPLWPRFLAVLDRHADGDRAAMIAGAQLAFHGFADSIQRALTERGPGAGQRR